MRRTITILLLVFGIAQFFGGIMRLQAGELSGNTASLLAIGGACLIGALALLLLPRKSGNLLGALACLTNGADLVMYNIVPGLKMGYVGAFASLIVGLSIWGACWLILDLMRADPSFRYAQMRDSQVFVWS